MNVKISNKLYHKYDFIFETLFWRIILIKCLCLVARHSTIFNKNSQNLNNSSSWIPNTLDFLDKMAEWQASEDKHLICIKIIFRESVPIRKLGHECLHFKPHYPLFLYFLYGQPSNVVDHYQQLLLHIYTKFSFLLLQNGWIELMLVFDKKIIIAQMTDFCIFA